MALVHFWLVSFNKGNNSVLDPVFNLLHSCCSNQTSNFSNAGMQARQEDDTRGLSDVPVLGLSGLQHANFYWFYRQNNFSVSAVASVLFIYSRAKHLHWFSPWETNSSVNCTFSMKWFWNRQICFVLSLFIQKVFIDVTVKNQRCWQKYKKHRATKEETSANVCESTVSFVLIHLLIYELHSSNTAVTVVMELKWTKLHLQWQQGCLDWLCLAIFNRWRWPIWMSVSLKTLI